MFKFSYFFLLVDLFCFLSFSLYISFDKLSFSFPKFLKGLFFKILYFDELLTHDFHCLSNFSFNILL